jgi:type VI secretion system secreted protein Hcp
MAETDYFLKLSDIEGEATASGHEKEIRLESWSWGETNEGTAGAGGGEGAGRVAMQDFNFVMQACKASPALMLKCAEGKHIDEAIMTCRKAGGVQEPYLKITMKHVFVSSYQTGGSSGDVIPMDQVSLNFKTIEYEYKPQKADGSLGSAETAGWDVELEQKI